jgi:ribosomal protein L18
MNWTRCKKEVICQVITAAQVGMYIAVNTSKKDFPKAQFNKNLYTTTFNKGRETTWQNE